MIKRYDNNWVMTGNNVMVMLYEKTKYESEATDGQELMYKDVDGFEVISGDKALYLDETFGDDADEHHEYVTIYMKNGDTATFRNSHVALFCM